MFTTAITTRSIGDSDGDTDGHGDLGIHGMGRYGDGLPHTTGTIGDADRYGDTVSTDITTIQHHTNTTSAAHSPTATALAKESAQG